MLRQYKNYVGYIFSFLMFLCVGCQSSYKNINALKVSEVISMADQLNGEFVQVIGYLSSPPVLLYEDENRSGKYDMDQALDISLKYDSREVLMNIECLNRKVVMHGVLEKSDNRYVKRLKEVVYIKGLEGEPCEYMSNHDPNGDGRE